jgi:ThiF family
MSQRLISLSADLKRLRDEGHEVEVRSGFLVIGHVPYVTPERQVDFGELVSELTLAGDVTSTPSSHVAMFRGATPCDQQGAPIAKIIIGSGHQVVATGVEIDHTFSSKPASGQYPDYYAKMTTYIAILGQYATAVSETASATTFKPVGTSDAEDVFRYVDTASSRAGIAAITARLETGPIAIVGLGGTGAYILDLVAKTPVREIHLWDGDHFLQHNAFRTPGAASLSCLESQPFKVDYFASSYSEIRNRIVPHPEFVSEENVAQVLSSDFVFMALDAGPAKRLIVRRLEDHGTPYIDVGMGVHEVGGSLSGLLRVTTSTAASREPASRRLSFSDGARDDYATNIQIADLNALNAALAVIRWKKHLGFYSDLENEHHSTYQIDGNEITNEDRW